MTDSCPACGNTVDRAAVRWRIHSKDCYCHPATDNDCGIEFENCPGKYGYIVMEGQNEWLWHVDPECEKLRKEAGF